MKKNIFLEAKNLNVTFYKNPSELSLFKSKKEKFKIIKNLNFKIYDGDRVAVIGKNGSGKSSLLTILTGIVPIDSGSIYCKYQTILLKPGIGLQNEMNIIENIFNCGLILGLEESLIKRKINDIIKFAELTEDIKKPIKFYSSGMKSRLIFSFATSFPTKILLMDELLGSGDISFKQKAEQRIKEFIKSNNVLIIATHSINYVIQHCNKAIYLKKNSDTIFGDSKEIAKIYMHDLGVKENKINLENI